MQQYSTQFLDDMWLKVPAKQRQWHIDNQHFALVQCKTCLAIPVKWSAKNKTYSRFCSSKCAQASDEVRIKTQTTCIDRFGATTNLITKENINKVQLTCLTKYGVDNYSKTAEFQIKFKAVCNIRYGVDNPSKLQWVQQKITQTHQDRYNRKRFSQAHIPMDVIALKNNVEEMNRWYFDLKMPITAIAEILGVNHSQLCVHFATNLGIDITRHRVSYPEYCLQQWIKEFEPTVVANDRTIISPKELDIVIPYKKIAIEYHGLAWHCEVRGNKGKTYHLDKLTQCQAQGYRVVQIFSNEWLTQQALVKSRLKAMLGHSQRISARACDIRTISSQEAKEFLDQNHIQRNCVSSVAVGLFDRGRLVMVLTMGKPRFNRNYQWELLRLATVQGLAVRGGASRLFTWFTRNYSPLTIISYCDRRWNTGNVYQQLGFDFVKNTDPNYWYTKDYLKLENRMSYQKSKLAQLLLNFDPKLTEWDNMQLHGFDRVWDCGNSVWSWAPHAGS